MVAPSKRCCPVCAVIQNRLSACAAKNIYPIYYKHRTISGCSFPLGLPRSVRLEVITHFRNLLRNFLENSKLRKASSTSGDSKAYSSESDAEDIPFRRRHVTSRAP